MRIGYFDCFSGASGDMILGSLIDAGLSPAKLRAELNKLRIPVRLRIKKVLKRGIGATQVIVEGEDKKVHRNLREMVKIIDRSDLDREIKDRSKAVLERIATVEGEIHQKPREEIHFHEIGGLDSIVDIAGAIWGVSQIGVDAIHVSKVNVGGGFVKCEHGTLPVPAPATVALMKGKPIFSYGAEKELLTPTGAALLTFWGSRFGEMPAMKVEKIGYGAGRDDFFHPNVLRLMVGTVAEASEREKVTVIETNIDDMNPQYYDYMMERLFQLDGLDVFLTPVFMKKNRPGTLLTVICPSDKRQPIAKFLLKETTTLGLRWREEEREKANREVRIVATKYGKIRFKVARWEGKIVNFSPEYDDCKRTALKKGIPIKDVFEEARKEVRKVLHP